MSRYIACLFALLVTIVLAPGAMAADVKVMISAGFFSAEKELGPAFEKSTGHKLITTRGPSIGNSPEAIPTRLARGEEADVVIMDGVGVDLLERAATSRVPGSRIPLAESFIGMVVPGRSAQARHQHDGWGAEDAARRANPSPIRTVRAALICRPSDSRSSALPTTSPASRARCAVPPWAKSLAAVVARRGTAHLARPAGDRPRHRAS